MRNWIEESKELWSKTKILVTKEKWLNDLVLSQKVWLGKWSPPTATGTTADDDATVDLPSDGGQSHLGLAQRSLSDILSDSTIPTHLRDDLLQEYRQIELLLDKIDQGHIHIVVFGRVGVGKSALLNALLAENRFSASPLHGETRQTGKALWRDAGLEGVFLIDTPGIDDWDGEALEQLAQEAAHLGDMVLFVVDGDLTDTEFQALHRLKGELHRPVLLAFNKMDRYTGAERQLVVQSLTERVAGLIDAESIVLCAASPGPRIYLESDDRGREREVRRRPPADVAELRSLLQRIVATEGKTLAALNATFHAGQLSDRLAATMASYHRVAAEKVIHAYCLGKGVAVAVNPVPVADLLVVVADAAMIITLGRVYGLKMNTNEAGDLVRTIMTQTLLILGTVWLTQLAASALKGVSFGVSTLLTAGTQGAVAYYGTYVVGRAAERYLAQGRSWGPGGPKQVVREILDTLDRDSMLAQARQEILLRLRRHSVE
ncbi:MAG: GTP-binding protein [Magnetococcales bacterium]|nr:GTP-binding protein [Magnetococcales bacterium]